MWARLRCIDMGTMLIGAASPIPLGLEAPATKLFRKGLTMNWEFLLGLLLPAYGVGYVWLIKTAREDPILYWEVAKHLKSLFTTLIPAALIVAAMFAFGTDEADNAKLDAVTLAMIFVFLMTVTLWSLSFFRRIATLPPKEK